MSRRDPKRELFRVPVVPAPSACAWSSGKRSRAMGGRVVTTCRTRPPPCSVVPYASTALAMRPSASTPSPTSVRWWTVAVAAALCCPAARCVAAAGGAVYTAPLDDTGRTTVYWTVDYAARSVKFEVHYTGGSPFDWLALGFSDRGNHTGADFCLLWVDWKGVTSMLVSKSEKLYGGDRILRDFFFLGEGELVRVMRINVFCRGHEY